MDPTTIEASKIRRNRMGGFTATTILVMATLWWSPATVALGTAMTGKITRVVTLPAGTDRTFTSSTGIVFVNVTGTISGTIPPCDTASNTSVASYAIDLGNPGGKTAVIQLLHAQALGYNVTVIGTSNCTLWDLHREDFFDVSVVYP